MSRSKRTIVTLCGSTRFFETFMQANYDETMAGRIVLSIGFYRPQVSRDPSQHPSVVIDNRFDRQHDESWGCTTDQKEQLDLLHFDKVGMCDEVLILNVDGYVGESTRNEIALALLLNKAVRWHDPARGNSAWIEENRGDLARRMDWHIASGRGEKTEVIA